MPASTPTPAPLAFLPFLFAVLAGCVGHDAEPLYDAEPVLDVSTPDADGAGGTDDAGEPDAAGPLTCAEIEERAEALLDGPAAACETRRDCVVVGGSTTCDCHTFCGPWPVRADARGAFDRLGEAFTAAGCEARYCDWPPLEYRGPVCSNGRCAMPELPVCHPEWLDDVGVPDVGWPDANLPDGEPDAE